MTWVLAGVAAAGAITSGVEANQTRQRNKGVLSQAYKLGQQRLNLSQQDTRESQGESLVSRGLTGGGGVRNTGPIGPQTGAAPLSVGGATTLGGQAVKDEAREQQLEQTSLSQESQNDLNANNAQADAAEVSAGIGAAGAVAGGIVGSKPSPAGSPATSPVVASGGLPTSAMPTVSPYGNSWGGIDPIHPLSRGSWSGNPNSTSGFNVFNPNQNQ